jgi:hypothetical protein
MKLHDVTTQKTKIGLFTAVRTSDLGRKKLEKRGLKRSTSQLCTQSPIHENVWGPVDALWNKRRSFEDSGSMLVRSVGMYLQVQRRFYLLIYL